MEDFCSLSKISCSSLGRRGGPGWEAHAGGDDSEDGFFSSLAGEVVKVRDGRENRVVSLVRV